MSDFEIVTRTDFSDVTYLLEVRHPQLAKAAKAGQFVIVMEHEHGERIPLTIADFDRDAGHDHPGHPGRGQDHAGDAAELPGRHDAVAVVGPMGIPSHIGGEESGLRRRRPGRGRRSSRRRAPGRQSGAYVIGVLGFRNEGLVFWEDKFRACCDELIVLHRRRFGRPQGPRHRRYQAGRYRGMPTPTRSVAIGRPADDEGCAERRGPFGIKTIVSLNPIMVDGTGMCGGCRVTVGGEIKFACVDGPDFDGHLVDFDD